MAMRVSFGLEPGCAGGALTVRRSGRRSQGRTTGWRRAVGPRDEASDTGRGPGSGRSMGSARRGRARTTIAETIDDRSTTRRNHAW
ncbi:hypothetical protein ACFPM0_16010 [Pseudonocardia sulfidoxydans]|uniref:hypothetical protein n=1 Tax=Pseudonocardia sulfidoxydans TaxID=54011 RepID=UPI003616BA8B